MRQIKDFQKNQRGELMLESLMVYSITIFLLFFLLAIFSVLFQRWNIQTIANEAVTRVAQTYKMLDADVTTGYIEESELTEVRPYRYMWNAAEAEGVAEGKLLEYLPERLRKTTFTKNVTEPQYEIEIVGDTLARRHIKLTIRGEYAVPFGEALAYFGFGKTTKYEITAYADCLDLMDYISTTDFVAHQTSLKKIKSSYIKYIDAILKLFDNLNQTLE